MKRIHTLTTKAKEEVKVDKDLLILTVVSSLLAGFGILHNNIYIMVGAMIVAPFFDPIISMVVLIYSGKLKETRKSITSLLKILLLSILTSLIFFFISSLLNRSITVFNYYDTIQVDSFIIAALLGFTGMLLWLWPKTSNTSAGIAVAVSLVPPLATISTGFIIQDYQLMLNAFIIVLVNLSGIIVGSYLALIMSYKKIVWKSLT
ncbi:MAG: DUF389 domain-containing protein [Patescibacteria group bacterium]|nr:DUF389 domain-containing protein [Patescibacteria group bacterium]